MRIFALLCVGLFFVISAQALEKSLDKTIITFEAFKALYNKTYPNKEEEKLRRAIFDSRVNEIQEHNERYKVGMVSWIMGVNDFTDRTEEEVNQSMKLKISLDDLQDRTFMNFVPNPKFKPLSEFDWRKFGAITPAKDQGHCGSCFIFASLAATEALYFRKFGKLRNLSEQFVLDCGDDDGCEGGNQIEAFDLISEVGVAMEEDYYEYADVQLKCRRKAKKETFKIDGYMRIFEEKDILEALQTIGPVTVAYSSQNLRKYFGGILSDKSECSKPNHAVTIVGFGTEGGKDYYTIKNSWGTHFGEDGFFRVERNVNYCGIKTFAFVPFVV